MDVLVSAPSATNARVAFGKIRSKLRTYDDQLAERYRQIYADTSEASPLQLFLTDYSSMYVARVVSVTTDDCYSMAPAYYKDKSLEVESWFIISDIRRIAHKDFELVRDNVLSNFTTPHFDNHRYAIYGNQYLYPMQVEMVKLIEYFEYEDDSDYRYFSDIFKSVQYQEMKQKLIDFRFGNLFYGLHPNSQDAVVSAEIEYFENADDALYDFSSVVLKLSKAIEYEIYLFLRQTFSTLMEKESSLSLIAYSVQGREYVLSDILYSKPNMGTYKYLLKNDQIKSAVNTYIQDSSLRYFILSGITKAVFAVQNIRNESAHGEATPLSECKKIRHSAVGIGENGILCDLITFTHKSSELHKK